MRDTAFDYNWNFLQSAQAVNVVMQEFNKTWGKYGPVILIVPVIMFILAFSASSPDEVKTDDDKSFGYSPDLERVYGQGFSEYISPSELGVNFTNDGNSPTVVYSGTGFMKNGDVFVEIVNIESLQTIQTGETFASETGDIVSSLILTSTFAAGTYLIVAVDQSSLQSQLKNAAATGQRPQANVAVGKFTVNSSNSQLFLPLISR